MRVFLAGASGVLGRRLVPLLLERGHVVLGMTRSERGASLVEGLGASALVCDVYDREALVEAVSRFAPDLILHELTDLPDTSAELPSRRGDNARIRVVGTQNLIAAAEASGGPRLVAQSVAWTMPAGPGADAVATLEELVVAYGGTVVRYGQLHGPGTFYETGLPDGPRIGVDAAAVRTLGALDHGRGVVTIVE